MTNLVTAAGGPGVVKAALASGKKAGGVGEGSPRLREMILSGLEFLGVALDPARNAGPAGERIITADGSRVAVAVVAADEELIIARDAWRAVTGQALR